MDQLVSVLLRFPPPGGGIGGDDHQYDAAAKAHSQQVDRLAASSGLDDAAAQLLDKRRAVLFR
ncbi:hypothetical protein VTH06DRAFT_6191 [Thermothelomyces fergusii]